jgi:hypothetical protein
LSSTTSRRERYLPKCPKDQTEVAKPQKTWKMAPKNRPAVTIGLFKCPKCGTFFRASIKK